MSHPIEIAIYFTDLSGGTAKITGDETAIRAIEEAFERAGIKYNEAVETWDEGFYVLGRDR